MSRLSPLMRILGERPISVHPIYLRITGRCLSSAYLLSQILYWDGVKEGDEFYKTDQEFCEELCLNIKQFRIAKDHLKELGFIFTVLRGVPAKTFYKINIEQLVEALENSEKPPVCPKGTNWKSNPSSLPIMGKLDCPKGTNLLAYNGQTTTEMTTETTTYIFPSADASEEDIDVSLKPRRKKKVDLEQQESDFQRWYDVYPRKAAREDAKKAFVKALKFISLEELIKLTKGYARSVEDKDTQYLPYPATWLNGQRWKDQPNSSSNLNPSSSPHSSSPLLLMDEEISRFLTENPSIKGNSLSSGFTEAKVLKEPHKIIIYHPYSFMLSKIDFFKRDLETYFGKPVELRKMQ